MSLFRKPKKTIQRRVFATLGDHEDSDDERVDAEEDSMTQTKVNDSKKDKIKERLKTKNRDLEPKTKSLLSFADDEDDGEVFQVKKSAHSKKVMRMLDKERRKKKCKSDNVNISNINGNNNFNGIEKNVSDTTRTSSLSASSKSIESKYNTNSSDNVQTEIRTDDFVLVVKKSEPEILNGRAAICAGRDDISSDGEESTNTELALPKHRFTKPNNLKSYLESGSIPDAAMIHAARKERQKAREQGDYIPLEEAKEPSKIGSRLAHDEAEDGSDEEERVDMNAITGVKEREERREKFYSVQNDYSEGDSDHELNEWENQQIRKGVTGAQLVSAVNQENLLFRFSIKSGSNIEDDQPQSTGTLLEQAYANNMFEKPRQLLIKTQKNESKASGPRTPKEINDCFKNRLKEIKELHIKHNGEVDQIVLHLREAKIEAIDYAQKAPTSAAKYRFYQELRCYVSDLIECLDEKLPEINDIEKRIFNLWSKRATYLIERRRQDVRDQAKEVADASKGISQTLKKGPEEEERQRRAAEREGRRTRRRCERERNEVSSTHLDGMSSDDEMHDQDISQYHTNLDQLSLEAGLIFNDVNEDFCQIENILSKFEIWRQTDIESYKDSFVSLCLPKIVGSIIRLKLTCWNPLDEKSQEIDKTDWYITCMQFAATKNESLESLKNDPDVKFVPTLVEKIVIPKLTELVAHCWDPLSTTQTLRLIGQIRKLGREYPLQEQSKFLKTLFITILDKLKDCLENDVFIPIFPKQMQEAKTSFFQRQFCSGLKLFRNILSWQGIIADYQIRELAITFLLNRYLLSAMRFCNNNDSVSKALVIVNTLPTAWLQPDSETIRNLNLLIAFINSIYEQLDKKNPLHLQTYEKTKQILQKLHSY
ncbi:PAX3- and PAX7-binding protein 1 isoform X2 [Condylostylus longicornis]|uniref:PAX3- and PAX7-binding protein 1 isoform X2 n=1 Tax=Condylostylus longicornis TaxID=2530218 RepID=UPI00244DDA4E|nr:PAX3- and PAX7-binding protein 1 isoform X2 [Condylostylus longicornis]